MKWGMKVKEFLGIRKHHTNNRPVRTRAECGYCSGFGGHINVWSSGVEFEACRVCDGEGTVDAK